MRNNLCYCCVDLLDIVTRLKVIWIFLLIPFNWGLWHPGKRFLSNFWSYTFMELVTTRNNFFFSFHFSLLHLACFWEETFPVWIPLYSSGNHYVMKSPLAVLQVCPDRLQDWIRTHRRSKIHPHLRSDTMCPLIKVNVCIFVKDCCSKKTFIYNCTKSSFMSINASILISYPA